MKIYKNYTNILVLVRQYFEQNIGLQKLHYVHILMYIIFYWLIQKKNDDGYDLP